MDQKYDRSEDRKQQAMLTRIKVSTSERRSLLSTVRNERLEDPRSGLSGERLPDHMVCFINSMDIPRRDSSSCVHFPGNSGVVRAQFRRNLPPPSPSAHQLELCCTHRRYERLGSGVGSRGWKIGWPHVTLFGH